MLFLLGFPWLRIEKVQDGETSGQASPDEVHEVSALSSSTGHRSVDVNVLVWRVRTVLAPQDISLMVQADLTNHTVLLRLRDNGGDGQFIWQDWADAVMGYMKGMEESGWGYGRQVVRPDLHRPMVELCPLRVDGRGIESVVKKTSTARIWLFEMDQWLAACDVNVNEDMSFGARLTADGEVGQAENEIQQIVRGESEDVEDSTQHSEV